MAGLGPLAGSTAATWAGSSRRIGLLQIDSVNVLSRAHYLPAYSRLGAYPRDRLDQLTWGSGRMFEYWAHEASFLPAELWPYFRWRMEERRGHGAWGRAAGLIEKRPGYLEAVLEEVRDRGPLSAREVSDATVAGGTWWSWSDAKVALEALFATGDVTVSERVNFERRYDLPERVLPADVVAAPAVEEHEARRELLRRSAQALGVATATDLYDYYRLNGPVTAPRLAELVEAGELHPGQGARLGAEGLPRARAPGCRGGSRRVPCSRRSTRWCSSGRAWSGCSTSATASRSTCPAPKRVYGYYVLPFLLGEAFVARVDLKADRAAGVLLVQSAWSEPGAPPDTVPELADELALLGRLAGPVRRVASPAAATSAPPWRSLAAAAAPLAGVRRCRDRRRRRGAAPRPAARGWRVETSQYGVGSSSPTTST